MGPYSRCLGPLVPAPQLWQDPVPVATYSQVGEQEISLLKKQLLESGLSVSQLTSTAWASASTFRGTDKRGGANGGRLRLSPQKNWAVNQPNKLEEVLKVLKKIQKNFNQSRKDGVQVSLADLIVLGGCVGVETAAKNAGHEITVPFTAGRTDASQAMTDVNSFAALEPTADGFTNYFRKGYSRMPEELLVDRANLLTLTAPEMTVLLGGMRVLNANFNNSPLGVFTERPETLTNDFFTNLLDMETEWKKSSTQPGVYEGRDRKTGNLKWTGTGVDLVFGSNSQLRAISEVYACEDGNAKFVQDFAAVWNKVMNLDRFDLSSARPAKTASLGAK